MIKLPVLQNNSPYRSDNVEERTFVFCKFCTYRKYRYKDGVNLCLKYTEYDDPNNVTGAIYIRYQAKCEIKNQGYDCVSFIEKPLSWWEKIFGRNRRQLEKATLILKNKKESDKMIEEKTKSNHDTRQMNIGQSA